MAPVSRTRRTVALVGSAALVGSLLTVGFTAGPAQAKCVESPQQQQISIGGRVVGIEEAQSSETCEGNGVYYGRIRDTYSDGSCVAVLYYDPSLIGTFATSCDSAGYRYTYRDTHGSRYSSYFRGKLTATGALSGEYLNVGY
ncbi:hypothetical protein V6V47_19310 [Micromonospora sp. CPCC 205539]|uniref:hypothetical protein n=1 Tax=Micromonospora sp. CPCC 205539 TaxID=3122408 RepID=UPI002FF1B8BA